MARHLSIAASHFMFKWFFNLKLQHDTQVNDVKYSFAQ
jgi:hypothetical protein